MNSKELDKFIDELLHPDIRCFVNASTETGASRVGIEYLSLGGRSAMVGGVKKGMLHIGKVLFLRDVKTSFIQIFDADKKLICNQEISIHIERHAKKEYLDKEFNFLVDIIPDPDESKTGFSYMIEKRTVFNTIVSETVVKNSAGRSILHLSKDILIRLFFGLIKTHGLVEDQLDILDIQINIHYIDFHKNYWKIDSYPFEIVKK